MNSKTTPHTHKWSRILRGTATLLIVAIASSLGWASWEYMSWRDEVIEWDFGTIDRLCGGDTDADRLLAIRFVKKWEYKALKQTDDGRQVWLHWKLSKRHCGNWMRVDKTGVQIRPFEVRFPNGAPRRQGVSCIGIPRES